MVDMIAQTFGIFGMLLAMISFQCKRNTRFFLLQALSGLLFSVNFLMIGAIGGALCNAANVVRGALFSKSDRVKWKLVFNLVMYFSCMVVSVITVWGDPKQMILTMLTITASMASTASMWTGNGAFIRKIQFFCSSPLWLIHNCFNFSLGGILCETFNMISVVVSFIRYGKEGFEK